MKKPKKNSDLSFKLETIFFLSGKDKKQLFENLTLMITSGIGMMATFKSLEVEAKKGILGKLIGRMGDEVAQGQQFWKVIKKYKLVPDHMITIIRIGEESGKLNENLNIVIEYMQREDDFRSKLRSASIYPMFVLIMLGIIASGISLFVLPNLAATYSNLNIDLPTLTKVMIDVGLFLDDHGMVVVPSIVAGTLALFYVIFVYHRTRFIGQEIMLRAPGIGGLIKEVEMSRLGYLFGTLLDAGVPLVESIKLMRFATTYKAYSRFYSELAEKIESGQTFFQGFAITKRAKSLISLYARQMIISSEKTAMLNESLTKIGKVYTRRSENTSKNLTVMIEPILLIVVWLGVAVIAFAVIMPVYTLSSSLSPDDEFQESQISDKQNDKPEAINLETDEAADQAELDILQSITVGETGAGYLNVRSSIGGDIIEQINDGQSYEYIESENGWYKIKLTDGRTGWVNGSYVIIED